MISEQQLKRYCCGNPKDIENYSDAISDTTQTWEIHHRRELTDDGDFAYSVEDLKEMKEYYNRPAEELIFLTESEHRSLHAKGRSDEHREKQSKAKKGIPLTAEHCENVSKSMKGSKNHFYGKTHSAVTREKISASVSKANKGKHWYNNGIENKFTYDCPEGFVKGRLLK